MESKKNLLICTHGRFGEELLCSAEMIIGPMADVYAVSLLPGTPPEKFKHLIEEIVKTMDGEIICLVDLFGGTPCSSTAMLSNTYPLHIISGLNLPMLLEMYMRKDLMDVEELISTGVHALKESGKDVIKVLHGK